MLDGGDSGNARCNGNGGAAIDCNAQADMMRRQAKERGMEFLFRVSKPACRQDAAVQTEDVGRRLRFEGRGSRVEGRVEG